MCCMCGIAGFIDYHIGPDAKKDLTHKMLRKIQHRGPEASNTYIEGPVALGHNRLKIIDLSEEANQPFTYDDVVMIYNGEVYNYIEVRDELLKQGYRFRTSSDTEVICAAYKHWGDDCMSHFMGMWALAIWDKTRRRLFCSRDRFGIKPFYYFRIGEHLYFASEYKAIKELPMFRNELNIEQVNRGMQMVWTVYHEQTFYRHLKTIRPGHNLVWEGGKITIKRYWDIEFSRPQSELSWEEKKEKFYALFKESVKMHARSDVKNGTLLSGGLDSSAISSMYSTLMPDSELKSFSIYYEGDGDVDERKYVREVVNKYPNIKPFYFSPSDQEITDNFHKVAYHADVPLLTSSYISQFFLMQLAKSEGVTVVVDGQGSDEYLGGYLHSVYRLLASDFLSLRPDKAFKLLAGNKYRENYSMSKTISVLMKGLVSIFSNENAIYNLEYSQLNRYLRKHVEGVVFREKTSNKLDSLLYQLLFNTTLQTLLHFEDRNSMAFSIESRVPFLDHRLVEFTFTLRNDDKISSRAETKYILRQALKPILPTAVAERKDKKGFVTPGEVKWLNGPLKFLLDIDYRKMDWMNTYKLKTVIENYKKGDTSQAPFVWRIACLDYWLKNFK